MCGVSRKLVERLIDREPESTTATFVDVDFWPRVVIERASNEGQAHRDRAGMPIALDIATNSAVCPLQSPMRVRSTSRADGRLTVGFFARSS